MGARRVRKRDRNKKINKANHGTRPAMGKSKRAKMLAKNPK